MILCVLFVYDHFNVPSLHLAAFMKSDISYDQRPSKNISVLITLLKILGWKEFNVILRPA
jgi:hypothetical protein